MNRWRTASSQLGFQRKRDLQAVISLFHKLDISNTLESIKNQGPKTLVLANAGHHAHPQLLRNGQLTPLLAKGMPLGMMAGISYREIAFELQSGDVIVFMTDGIIEAKDSNGQEYQETDRLSHVLAQFTADTSAEAMVTALIDDATTFGADMTPEEEDDITVVVVKVL